MTCLGVPNGPSTNPRRTQKRRSACANRRFEARVKLDLARRAANLKKVSLPAFRRRVQAAALPTARARDELLTMLVAVDKVLERLRRRVLGD
jgi:hypothetical protein